MCELCTQHGEGKKWYLAMENYSKELAGQDGRLEFMEDFHAHMEETFAKKATVLDRVKGIPFVYRFLRSIVERKQRKEHFGQIVPLEDAAQILDLADSVVRLPCVCRKLTTGKEARYCFGLGFEKRGILEKYPDYSLSLEVLEKNEAKELLRSFDEKGMIHSVWTFKTPYIGGLCNCDQDCIAYRSQVNAKLLQVMFRAEYVARVDWDQCVGCKQCIKQCQFGAIRFSNTLKRATIDMGECYGCGVCRAACKQDAISLKPRSAVPGLPW